MDLPMLLFGTGFALSACALVLCIAAVVLLIQVKDDIKL